MMTPKRKMLLAVISVVVPLDQLTKWLVESNIPAGSYVAPIAALDGFFRITHARNAGVALGLGQGVNVYFIVGIVCAALVLIAMLFRRLPAEDRLTAFSLGLIISGAVGNLIDRLTRAGEVVDFLQFNLGIFVFPDFNVADSAIVIGVALLLLDIVAQETEEGVTRKSVPGGKDG